MNLNTDNTYSFEDYAIILQQKYELDMDLTDTDIELSEFSYQKARQDFKLSEDDALIVAKEVLELFNPL